jgi:hypothetical protein
MIEQVFRILVQAFVPVAALSFGLTWWAIRQGFVDGDGTLEGFQSEFKSQSKALSRKNRKKRSDNESEARPLLHAESGREESAENETPGRGSPGPDLLHRKWMKFGGGFYGVVAFYTWLVIEYRDIAGFIEQFNGLGGFLANLGPSLLVSIFVESLLNFIAAMVWPATWLTDLRGELVVVWLIAAWLGYRVGTQLALRQRHTEV